MSNRVTQCPECANPVYYSVTKPAPNAAKVRYGGSPLAMALSDIATYRQEQDIDLDDKDADWRALALRLEGIARQASGGAYPDTGSREADKESGNYKAEDRQAAALWNMYMGRGARTQHEPQTLTSDEAIDEKGPKP